jgi:hypothetical protein
VSERLLTWERQLMMSTVRARSSSPSTRTTSRVAILSDRSCQGVTKRCRQSLLTNSALVIRVQMQGEGGSCGVSANENSCAHHVTWSPNILWRSISIFNLWAVAYPGGMHRMHVHPPTPPCASPPWPCACPPLPSLKGWL